MGLLRQKGKLYDRVRKKWVVAHPEEVVRQTLISLLVDDLGYPIETLCVEKNLSMFPAFRETPPLHYKRRIDLLCLEKQTLSPLLLVECKDGALKPEMQSQLFGYNYYVQAPLLVLINQLEYQMFWTIDVSLIPDHMNIATLPSYSGLLDVCNQVSVLRKALS